jgi:hypothetical protein
VNGEPLSLRIIKVNRRETDISLVVVGLVGGAAIYYFLAVAGFVPAFWKGF